MGRIQQIKNPVYELNYGYEGKGNVTSITGSNGVAIASTYKYYDNDWRKEARQGQNMYLYVYDAAGNCTKKTIILGPMEDENKWVIIDTNTLEFIPIPMGQKEYSCGTIAWSNDDRYLVIDIERITQTDSNCVDIDKAGILIFDTKTKKVIQKNLHESTDSWLVQGLKYPQVLFLNAEKNLCIYNANANINMVIYKEKLIYVLWGPNKEVYAVVNGRLAKIRF